MTDLFGLPKKCIADIRAVFRQFPTVERALIFGSRAMGNYKPGSDVDLALLGKGLAYDDLLKITARLGDIPWAYTYDVVIYDQISNPAVQAHIDDLGLNFYEQEKNVLKLKEIAEINMGQSPEGSTCNESGVGFPLLNGPTEFGPLHPFPVQFTTDPKKFAEAGDLLFCVRGSTTGRMNWADQRYAIGRGIASIRHRKGKEYQRFLQGAIEFKLDSLLAEATGSTFPNVSKQQIENLDIPFISFPTQHRISAILIALDDKIELNRRMNETLEGMAQAIWQEWFGTYGNGVKELPKGWKWGIFEELIGEFETGGRPKGGVKEIYFGIPSIGAESITKIGEFDYSKTRYIPEDFFEKMNKGLVRHKDILIYKDGGSPGNFIPHISMFGFGFPFEKCAINEHVYRFQTKLPIFQNYMYLWLNSDICIEEMKNKGTGVAIPGLNSTAVKSLSVLIPSKDRMFEFDKIIEPLFSLVLKIVYNLTISQFYAMSYCRD